MTDSIARLFSNTGRSIQSHRASKEGDRRSRGGKHKTVSGLGEGPLQPVGPRRPQGLFADASGSNGTNGAVVEQEPLGEPGWARERFSKLLKTWRRRNEGKEETVIKGRSQRGRSQRDFCRSWCL